jgi:hypothetical protein
MCLTRYHLKFSMVCPRQHNHNPSSNSSSHNSGSGSWQSGITSQRSLPGFRNFAASSWHATLTFFLVSKTLRPLCAMRIHWVQANFVLLNFGESKHCAVGLAISSDAPDA